MINWLPLIAGCVLAVTPARADPSIDAYGRLPSVEDVALSPDGSKLAFVQTTEDARAIVVYSLTDGKTLRIARAGNVRLRSLQWADNTHVLLTTASNSMPFELQGEKREWRLMSVLDVNGGRISTLLEHVQGGVRTMNAVFGRPVVRPTDKGTMLYLHGHADSDHHMVPALFLVNLTTGAERLIRRGQPTTRSWLIDDDGAIAAEQEYIESAKGWAIQLFRDGKPQQTVSGPAPIDEPEMLGLTADGQSIVVAMTEEDRYVWKVLSRRDASWGPDPMADQHMTELVLGVGSDRMIGAARIVDHPVYRFVDPKLQDNWDWVVRVFGKDRLELVSQSADLGRVVVRVMGPSSGYGYHLADIGEHVIRPLGKVYEGVAQIAEVRAIKYPAGDGLVIPAYLTLPPGRAAKGLPAVVLPHGGPQARDSLDFDWWPQALASQGYAVLQPNFRGSALGRKWVGAGYGEFGGKMQSDLSDGVRYLAELGVVDPRRVCIAGASYGGYAALAGVTLQSDVYRCAVAVAGISDLDALLQHVHRAEAYGSKIGERYWARFLAVDGPGDARLRQLSPLQHVANVSVPVMLIHGRDDVIVPYDQSSSMAAALRRAGKSVEFVTLDKEDHYLSQSATRLQMLRATTEFLRKYNPAD